MDTRTSTTCSAPSRSWRTPTPLLDLPDGRLVYQVLRDLRPDVAIIAAAGRGNVDGEPIQGSLAQFVAQQVDMLRPSQVILSHQDNWLPGLSVPTDIEPIRAEIERTFAGVELREIGYVDASSLFE